MGSDTSVDTGARDRVLLAAVLGAALVRLWGLGRQSYWYDEWLTTEAVAGGPLHAVRHSLAREGIAPTWFVGMWAWSRVAGDGEVALRSLSVLAGVAIVPVAYVAARQLGQRRRVARAAAVLAAVDPMLVWYSQEARPYSLIALVGGLSLLATIRLDAARDRRSALWWGAAGAVAVALHYVAAFLLVGELSALALRSVPRRLLGTAIAPVAVVGAVLAPVALEQHSHAANRSWIGGFPLADRLDDAARTALVGPSTPRAWVAWLVLAVVVAAALVSLVGARRWDRRVCAALVGLAACATLLPLAAGLVGTDVFLGRYVIAAATPLLVALAVALTAGSRANLGGVAVVLVAAIWLAVDVAVARDADLQRSDWRAVAATAREGGGVLVVGTAGGQSGPLGHYLPDGERLGADDSVVTDTVDVLVTRRAGVPCNFFVGRACAFVFLGGGLPDGLADRFAPAGVEVLDQFVVERYRADAPVRLDRDDLTGGGRGAAVWVP